MHKRLGALLLIMFAPALPAQTTRPVPRVFPNRLTGMFSHRPGSNTRDPMTIRIGDLWHCYYTAHADRRGAVFSRSSRDMNQWSDETKVASGGELQHDEQWFIAALRPDLKGIQLARLAWTAP